MLIVYYELREQRYHCSSAAILSFVVFSFIRVFGLTADMSALHLRLRVLTFSPVSFRVQYLPLMLGTSEVDASRKDEHSNKMSAYLPFHWLLTHSLWQG